MLTGSVVGILGPPGCPDRLPVQLCDGRRVATARLDDEQASRIATVIADRIAPRTLDGT
ncbi:hypothetical protein [Kitasatospora sp. NBC_01539]|uniref:hypothetical protein n=1 Tax=Kitasatospora sp. NBC_01539 TaxID=2903577 RepID=UPI0038600D20